MFIENFSGLELELVKNPDYPLLGLLYEEGVRFVIKSQSEKLTNHEFIIGRELGKLPNYQKCVCQCTNCFTDESMCMPIYNIFSYTSMGSLGNFVLESYSLTTFKNILKQVIFASLYSYEKMYFIHGNLHVHNVLLRKRDMSDICFNYGKQILELSNDGFKALICDFEHSTMGKINSLNDVNKEIMDFLMSVQKCFTCLIVKNQNVDSDNDYWKHYENIVEQIDIK